MFVGQLEGANDSGLGWKRQAFAEIRGWNFCEEQPRCYQGCHARWGWSFASRRLVMQTFPQHIFYESSKCQKLIISFAFAVCHVCGNGHVSVSATLLLRLWDSVNMLTLEKFLQAWEGCGGAHEVFQLVEFYAFPGRKVYSISYWFTSVRFFFPFFFSLLQQSLSALVPLSKSRLGLFGENKAFIHFFLPR